MIMTDWIFGSLITIVPASLWISTRAWRKSGLPLP
jgi:hypothetical protein